jgi:LysR family hydrogen peroxide-inducible transcriptional activator
MNVTLKQVEYFIALVRERNFGRAAAMMNISQPALSVQIKELEDRLGAQLVERQSRDVVPTPFGRMILEHCYAIQNDVRALEEAARWRGGGYRAIGLGVNPDDCALCGQTDVIAALRASDLNLRVRNTRRENRNPDRTAAQRGD